MFNKAFEHMSEHIDGVYKNLTKSKAFPDGGLAFLSLEDAEVGCASRFRSAALDRVGTVLEWGPLQCDAAGEAIRRDGTAIRRREDHGRSCLAIRSPQVSL